MVQCEFSAVRKALKMRMRGDTETLQLGLLEKELNPKNPGPPESEDDGK